MRPAILIARGRNGRPNSKRLRMGSGCIRATIVCALLAALGGAEGLSEGFARPNFGLARYPRPRRFMPEPRDPLWDLLPEPKRPLDDEERIIRRLLPLEANRLLPLVEEIKPRPLETNRLLPLVEETRPRPFQDSLFTEGAGRFSEVVDYERARLRAELREALMEKGAELEEEGEGREEEEGAGPRDEDRFEGAELADRADDFAYAPSDPRYFEKVEIAQVKDFKMDPSPVLRSDPSSASTRQRASPSPPPPAADGRRDGGGGVEVVAVRADGVEVDSAGVYVIAVVAGISAAATVGLIAVGIGWYNLQKHVKNASDVEYPAYGVTGPNKDLSPSGDRRLAQSAQMYHYQHQKQQIIAMERAQPGERHGSVSEVESDEENEEGDYTVYECPGLAPTGEMEVKNPLFQDDATPAAQTPAQKK